MAENEQFTKVGDGLLVRAPGKINLSLLVAGKREDGYHDIETIMAKINWFDEILIEPGDKAGIELICQGPYQVPEGEENLVYKAAKLILETVGQKTENGGQRTEDGGRRTEDAGQRTPLRPEGYTGQAEDPASPGGLRRAGRGQKTEDGGQNTEDGGLKTEDGGRRTEGIRLTLTKHIPAGSGLGSGSSDAAATLMGINKFFKLGLGKRELAGLAAKLGSDVAFFLDGPLALCTGRGEKVKKLAKCEFRVLLIVPNVSVSTQRVYENYRHDDAKYRRLREEINVYIEKKRIDLICSMGANMLQESCFELHTELGELKKRIESLGVRPVCLSGSGSSMFSIINNSNEEGVNGYRDKLERDYGCKSIIVNNNSW
ncbi:MAG: 4-(cytidine 5'-diphospho)-2-C-methyl-D-erythritol kinase [Sedimentisphaerales bacterium]|nr:4-(cytidine 5'-diphospho)-2-C-methyl-D-erythritol kinase [Sedimentisphaerales bacterium]